MAILTQVNDIFVVAEDLSSSFNSSVVDARDYGSASIQGTFTTSDPVSGSIAIEVSDDGQNFGVLGDAVDFDETGVISISSTSLPSRYWRIAVTITAGGSGDTISMRYVMKPYMAGGAITANITGGGGGGTSQTIDVFRAAESNADDSDKTIAITSLTCIESIFISYTSDATSGSRQIVIEFLTGGSAIIAQSRSGITQAANLTRYYMFHAGASSSSSFVDTDYALVNMPSVLLESGESIRIYDNNAVSASGDDMIVMINGYTIT